MPAAPVIIAVAVGSGAAAVVGGAIGAAIVGSAISTVAATAIGAGVVAGTITAVSGGSASDVLKSAVIGGASSYAGGLVGDYVGSAIAEATGSKLAGTIVGNVSSGITKSVITGQDIETGVVSGLVASLPVTLKEIPGFTELPKAAQNAIIASAATAATGGDVENALVNSLVMSSNLVGKAVSSIPEADAYFRKAENADAFRVLSATVNSALSASIQGKPVNAAVNKALINTTASVLQKAIDGGIEKTVTDAKSKYTTAQKAETALKANIDKYEEARGKYNAIAGEIKTKQDLRQKYIDEFEKYKADHEKNQGKLSTEELNKIADKANAALKNANTTTDDLNKYYENNKKSLDTYKTDMAKYEKLMPDLEKTYNTAVDNLDTASKAIVEKNKEIAAEVDKEVKSTVKDYIAGAGSGTYNEKTGVWTMPTVVVTATKGEDGWQSATADNGWEVIWNEKQGIIELYDPEKSFIDPVQTYKGKWGNGSKNSTGIFDQMSYFIDTAKDSFLRSAKQTGSLMFDVLPGMVAKVAGNEDYFNKQMSEAAATLKEINAKYPERVASYKDVKGFKDAMTYGVEAVTAAVVTTVPTLLMGGAAGVAARAAVKSTIDATLKRELAAQAAKGVTGKVAIEAAQSAATKAAIATASKYTVPAVLAGSASQNIPEVFQNVYNAKDGKVDLKDVAVSTLVGSFNAALDAVLPSALVDKLNLSKIPVEEVIGAWYKKAAKEGASAFIREGGTEAIQEMGSAAAESFLAENKAFFTAENLDRFIDAGLKGALGGSAISTSVAVGKEIASGKSTSPDSTTLYNQGLDNTTTDEYIKVTTDLNKAGFNYGAADIAAIAGKANLTTPKAISDAVTAYVDPRMVDRDEIIAAGKAEGITLTEEQIKKYIGQKDEATTITAARKEFDPLGTVYSEAEALFKDVYGYPPTQAEVNQFVKNNLTEAQAKTDIGAYVDPRQVTYEEAEQFFKDIGYKPTKEEINQFVRQGATVKQTDVQTELGEYVDPRFVTPEEVTEIYKTKYGWEDILPTDVERLTGQYDESLLADKAKDLLSTFQYNATKSNIDATRTELSNKMAEYEAAGIARDEALQMAINDVSTDLQNVESNLTQQITETETRLSGDIQNVADLVGKPVRDVTQADIDFANSIIAQQTAQPDMTLTPAQMAYDINQDGIISALDTQLLEQLIASNEPFTPPEGTIWAQPTGLYGELKDVETGLTGQIKDTQAQLQQGLATTQQKANVNTLMQMLGQAPDLGGQQVTVKAPDPTRIGYVYDIAGPSIFATPQQAQMFVSPYAQGGMVEDDVTAELLRILRS